MAFLAILFGIVLLISGLAIAVLSNVLGPLLPIPPGFGFALGILILLFGVLLVVSGIGLLRLEVWAWWLATITLAIGIIVSILFGDYITAGVEFLLLLYLAAVRRSFA